MKKITLFTIAAMLVAFSANAQKKITYGIKGGLNVSMITNLDFNSEPNAPGVSGWTTTESNISFNIGAYAEWRLNRFFGVAPELLYSSQGVGATSHVYAPDNSSVNVKSTLNLSYLHVPVMAKLYPLKWLSIDVGPQVGLLIAAKTKSEIRTYGNDGTSELQNETTNSKNDMNTLDFSFAGGLTFNLGKHVFLQGRYTLGITEVFKKKDGLMNDKTHANQVLQIGMGCRF